MYQLDDSAESMLSLRVLLPLGVVMSNPSKPLRQLGMAAALFVIVFITPRAPAQEQPATENRTLETATFGGGCFWCTEAVFQQLKGVESVVSGYMGGQVDNPTYKQVCSGQTGHAEVIQITFDPSVIDFAKLLEIHIKTHDPTTLNRQGADVGTQYRSAIFYHTPEQKETSEAIKKKLGESGAFRNPIVTEIVPAVKFYPAEDYHQNYFNENPGNGYCRAVALPKIRKVRKVFSDYLKEQ